MTEKGIVKDAFSEKNYATIGRSVKTFLLATHPDRNPGDAVANSNFVEYAEDAKTIKGICSSEWDFFKLVVYRDEQSEETCLETRGNRMDEQLFATGCIDPVERALYKKAKAALKEVKATIKEEEKAAEVAAAAVAEERRKAAEAAAIEAARKEAEEAAKAAELKAAREARKAASAAKAAERKACEEAKSTPTSVKEHLEEIWDKVGKCADFTDNEDTLMEKKRKEDACVAEKNAKAQTNRKRKAEAILKEYEKIEATA